MKKKENLKVTQKRLQLNRETIRILKDGTLETIAGGFSAQIQCVLTYSCICTW